MWSDPGKILLVVAFTLPTFSTLIVALRLYARCLRTHVAGLSDYIMVVALVSAWLNTILNYYQTTFGKEARPSQVQKNFFSPRVQAALSGTLITWFIYRPFYIVTLSLIKLSILAFYRTLIPPSTIFRSLRSFRYIVYGLITFTIIYTISMVLASVLQCTPIPAGYTPSGTIRRPRCYKTENLWVFSAIINFATDILIFILPIPLVVTLQSMPRRKKIGLFCILSVGTLATAASAVRMWILVLWSKNTRSQAKFGPDLLMWGQVEVNCGIVGASAMFLRPLFAQFFQKKENRLEAVNRDAQGRVGVEMKDREVSVAPSEVIIGGDRHTADEESRPG